MIRRTLIGLLAAALSSSLMLPVMAPSASAVTGIDWPTYQFQNAKGSYNASATAITPSNVNALTQEWRWVPNPPTMTGQPGAQIQASPTVYQGRIYIGSRTGVFYALDETTGAVVWSRFVGFQTGKTCSAQGFSSTATIANDPVTGMPTVYVANFAGTVVALNAADGAVRWSRVVVTPSSQANDYALWGSPAVANGHVYIGTSSACDQPLVRAGVVQLNQATGAIQNEYFTQAAGRIGGSIWSSVAVDPAGGDVYATTGNPNNVNQIDDSYSIVRLDGSTLVREDKWTVPVADQTFDADFGATPVLYTATLGGISTPMVAACNKNGILYALRRNNLAAGPVWQRRIGNASSSFDSCIGGVAWDGERLYQGGPTTTVGGASFPGSIRALNPSTGAVIWERGLPANVIQTPTVNGSGVLGIATYNTTSSTTNFAYLIDADTGAILRTWNTLLNGGVFAQMVFADDFVFIPSTANGMRGMKAPAGTGNVPPVARFTASCSGLVCSFDGGGSTDSDGTVTAWAWDFGDGSTDTGAQVQHPYASAGTRTVTLTVTDDGGAQAQTSQTVSPTSGGGGTAIFSDDFSSGDAPNDRQRDRLSSAECARPGDEPERVRCERPHLDRIERVPECRCEPRVQRRHRGRPAPAAHCRERPDREGSRRWRPNAMDPFGREQRPTELRRPTPDGLPQCGTVRHGRRIVRLGPVCRRLTGRYRLDRQHGYHADRPHPDRRHSGEDIHAQHG